jgi:hypothetical protein
VPKQLVLATPLAGCSGMLGGVAAGVTPLGGHSERQPQLGLRLPNATLMNSDNPWPLSRRRDSPPNQKVGTMLNSCLAAGAVELDAHDINSGRCVTPKRERAEIGIVVGRPPAGSVT